MERRAAARIQGAFRIFLARREWRQRCIKVFRKEFDPESFTHVYVDQRTEEPQLHKPYGLGSFDMRMRDEWVAMRQWPPNADPIREVTAWAATP